MRSVHVTRQLNSCSTWNRKKTALFSGHYLRNRSTLDIGTVCTVKNIIIINSHISPPPPDHTLLAYHTPRYMICLKYHPGESTGTPPPNTTTSQNSTPPMHTCTHNNPPTPHLPPARTHVNPKSYTGNVVHTPPHKTSKPLFLCTYTEHHFRCFA
jgi:hypothetical protein